MPKLVDHHARRAELAEAAAVVLTREGLGGFTTREIAAEAGVSKGILDHYFASKGELFITVLELFYSRVTARMRAAVRSRSGKDAVRAAMAEGLPIDERRRKEAVAEVAFAAQSSSDPAMRRWYRSERSRLRERLVDFIESAERSGDVVAHVAADDAADLLLALMDSLSLQSVIRDDLAGEYQLAALDRTLDMIFD